MELVSLVTPPLPVVSRLGKLRHTGAHPLPPPSQTWRRGSPLPLVTGVGKLRHGEGSPGLILCLLPPRHGDVGPHYQL